MKHSFLNSALVIVTTLLLLTGSTFAQVGVISEEEQLRQAERYFKEKNYDKALTLYSQIVSNQPTHAYNNYCLGICIMKVDGDKADAVRFLTTATQSPDVPTNAWLYLGKALHRAYRYEEAIATTQKYKAAVNPQIWNESGGEQLISQCQNAIQLNNDLSLLRHSIVDEHEISRPDFFSRYTEIANAGRFLKMPKEYEDKLNKGTPEGAFVFLCANNTEMVFAGQSKTPGNGFDIFRVTKDAAGMWKFPEPLANMINTKGNEAFPVLVDDGRTLYFSSNGDRSTGGYDVFRSDYNPESKTWSEPVSMGSPVNSPGDDFYYVPRSDDKTSFFSSDRESSIGKCKVYTASIISDDRKFATINGTLNCPSGLDMSDAKVTILNAEDRSLMAQFRTPSQNGTYFMKLPVPSTLVYQVKLAGFSDTESEVNLQNFTSSQLFQEIQVLRDEKGNEKLVVTTRQPDQAAVVTQAAIKTKTVKDEPMMLTDRTAVAPNKSASSNMAAIDKSENETPLVSVVNTKSTDAKTTTTDKTAVQPVSGEKSDAPVAELKSNNQPEPLVSVVNTKSTEVKSTSSDKTTSQSVASAKTDAPVAELKSNTQSAPLVSVVNTKSTTSDKATSQPVTTTKSDEPVAELNSNTQPAPLVSVVKAKSNDVKSTTTDKATSEPVTNAKNDASVAPVAELKSNTQAEPLVSVVSTKNTKQETAKGVNADEKAKTENFASEMNATKTSGMKQENLNPAVAENSTSKSVAPSMVPAAQDPNSSLSASIATNKNVVPEDSRNVNNGMSKNTNLVVTSPASNKEIASRTTTQNILPVEASAASKNKNKETSETKNRVSNSEKTKNDKNAGVALETKTRLPQILPVTADELSKNPVMDVNFKVQLGAYKNRVEKDLKIKYEKMGIKDLEFMKNDAGYLLVLTGDVNNYENATHLKESIISQGVKDAFVVVYSGEKRLPLSLVVEAED